MKMDEMAQVIQMEVEGTKMVFKGTLEVAAWFMGALKSMIKHGSNRRKEKKEKKANDALEEPGMKTFKEILQLSDGSVPTCEVFPEDLWDEVDRIAIEMGLHYCQGVDFNPNDKKIPIHFPPKEANAWGRIFESVKARKENEAKEKNAEYDGKMAEAREKLLTCKEAEPRLLLETNIENLKKAKEERGKYTDEMTGNKNNAMSFYDYMRQAKDTDFEKNPEAALIELEKGVEIGKKMPANEVMQPIRDTGYMPERGVMFYVPDNGMIVSRKFEVDGDGLVYSKYMLKSENGEIYTCTDRGITDAKWNSDVLPELLDKAGILEGTPCRVFDSVDKLKAYLKYHGTAKITYDRNFSSAEVKNEVAIMESEHNKLLASASVRGESIVVICNPSLLSKEGGKLRLNISSDEGIVFSKISDGTIKEGMACFTISEESNAVFVKKTDGMETKTKISPKDVETKINAALGAGNACVDITTDKNKGR
jgi:hypothetical protein